MARRAWTIAEEHRLRAMFPDAPTSSLASEFRRSYGAIAHRAHALGLRKSAEYMATAPTVTRTRFKNR